MTCTFSDVFSALPCLFICFILVMFTTQAPFSAIHVGAASPTVPKSLIDQVAPNGAMIIPVGPEHGSQTLFMVKKDTEGKVTIDDVCGVRYVPLCDLNHQLNK